jgi:VanZ family protein
MLTESGSPVPAPARELKRARSAPPHLNAPGPAFPHGHAARRWICLLLAALLLFHLFYLGAQPQAAGLIPAPWDKLAHAAVFGAFAALLWIASDGRMPLTVLALLVAAAAGDELRQATLPGRTADAVDFLVDVGAGAVAIGLLALRGSTRPQRRSAGSLPPRRLAPGQRS